jgi:mannose-6-phosphate isomerase-like protein (cupin superfamily)
MKKLNMYDIGGDIVKEDERYIVRDNKSLNNLIVSSTDLKPNKNTTGHKHLGQEEVYYFLRGFGKMELDNDLLDVSAGDIILIEDNVFHKVYAGKEGLYFLCVFDGKRNH